MYGDEEGKTFRIAILILKFVNQEITATEGIQLEEWINERPENEKLFQQLINRPHYLQEIKKIRQKEPHAAWLRLQSKIKDASGVKKRDGISIPRILKVAASVAGISILSWLWLYKSKDNQKDIFMEAAITTNDVGPGITGAELMLSNGNIVHLGKNSDSSFREKGNLVNTLKEGRVVYQRDILNNADTGYNLLQTANGEEYNLVLEDGTKVWLNAATELSFPVSFGSQDRKVSLTGEAYFEVAHDAKRPFKVLVRGLEVKVLGTHFNVSAYDDETISKTTLFEGSIKLSIGSKSAIIKPGQQVQVNKGAEIKVFEGVDLDQAVAWKNGYFQFKRDDLPNVIRQLTRWYDIKVKYEGPAQGMQFGGRISRNSNLSEVVKILELSGVRFRIEGKTLVVIH